MQVQQITLFGSEIVRLPHNRHLSFMQRMVERTQEQLVKNLPDGCPDNLKAACTTLKQRVAQEDVAFKKQLGSDLTPQIKAADEERDNTLSGIRTLCEAYTKIGTDDQKAGAAVVLKYIALYKVLGTDSYEDEGIKLQQLCDDSVKVFDFASAVTKCGLTSLFATLKRQNDACRTLINQRNEERAEQDPQAMNKCRAATDEAYADFTLLLNAYAVVENEEGYSRFNQAIAVINADIDYYKQWVLRKTGGSSSPDDQPSDDGGSHDTTPDGKQDDGSSDDGKGDSDDTPPATAG